MFLPDQGIRKGWRSWLPPGLMLVALLMLTRPFRGVFHDGYLYAAQTLARLGTPGFTEDIFLKFGNQDSFSVFTIFLAPFVRLLGLNHATMLFWALGLVFWAGALATLAAALFADRRARILALFGALILAPGYGDTALYYGENFVTPRIFSEAFGMLAIAAALVRRPMLTVFLSLMACALHPLMGLAVVVLNFWLFYPSVLLFFGLMVFGMLAGVALALLGLSPFVWLLETMDDQWKDMAHYRSIALASSFGISGLLAPVLPSISLVLVAIRDEGTRARVAGGVLLVSGVMVALSLVGADLLGNRLLVGLQLWRALFLETLLGNLFAIFALSLMPGFGRGRLLLLIAIILNAAEHAGNIQQLGSSAVAVAAVVTALWEVRTGRPVGLVLRVLGLTVAALALASVAGLLATYALHQWADEGFAVLPLRTGLVALLASALLIWPTPRWRGFVFLASLVGIVGAFRAVDQRTAWQRHVEGGDAMPSDVIDMVQGRVVYWENGLDMMWVKLHQPQFFSCRQQAGLVFFRAQAEELRRRTEILSGLNTSDFMDAEGGSCPQKRNPGENGPEQPEQLHHVCGALPELEVMVLLAEVGGLSRLRWSDPTGRIFHFYDCTALREGLR